MYKEVLLSLLLLLLVVGCAERTVLTPAPGAQDLPGEAMAAVAEVAGVDVVVNFRRWTGMSEPLPDLIPRAQLHATPYSPYSRSSVLGANISSGLTWRGRMCWSWANWITASSVFRLCARP